MKTKFTLLLLLSFCTLYLTAQDYRYSDDVFTEVTKTQDIVYGQAPALAGDYTDESNTVQTDLILDVYSPTGDTETNRPLIIFAHGGAFISGNRNHDDMVAYCQLFAKKGYVTATIDYRLGMNIYNAKSATRAVYRGLQDGRTAVRYFRNNAATYGIDPNKIYFGGSSAGAFIALQAVYMNTPEEKPDAAGSYTYTDPMNPLRTITAPDLGDYDLISTKSEYNGTPNAIFCLWGGVQHSDLIVAADTLPIFLVHGKADEIVPFDIGAPFNSTVMPATYGSKPISEKLATLNQKNVETYFVDAEGHEFYGVSNGNWVNGNGGNEYWDIIAEKAVNFFRLRHKPEADFDYAGGSSITFTDKSTDAVSWLWDFGDGSSSELQNPVHTYSADDTYTVKLYVENEHGNWDESEQSVVVNTTGIQLGAKLDVEIYPNPAQNSILVKTNNNNTKELSVFDVTGKLKINEVFSKNKKMINISDLTGGVYIVQIKTNEELKEIKFMKQ